MRIEGTPPPPPGMPPSGQPNPSYYGVGGKAVELIQLSHTQGSQGDAENLAKDMQFNCPPAMRDAVHGFLRTPSEESLNEVLAYAPNLKSVLMGTSALAGLQQALEIGDKDIAKQFLDQLSPSIAALKQDLPNLGPNQKTEMETFLDKAETLSKQTSIAPEDLTDLMQSAASSLVALGVQNARDFFGV